jgi:hypothetical protein
MSVWQQLLCAPKDFRDDPSAEDWFDRIATRLLYGSRVSVGKESYRFVEIEFYYCGDLHPDPFTHRDPLQLECGRWYFHRTRGTYRSGSFKGLDLTFGDGEAFGGVLIRGIETSDGTLIDGPSLCVDHLLASAGMKTVAAFDKAIEGRLAWDPENPLSLEARDAEKEEEYVRSARVGLSLKKISVTDGAAKYIMRAYRYLSEPRRTSKGKIHMVLALHARGVDPEKIREITGCPKQSIQRYIDDFEAGRKEKDFAEYVGVDLNPKALCRLYGTWCAQMED